MNEINIEKTEQVSSKIRRTGKIIIVAPIISSIFFSILILIFKFLETIFSSFTIILMLTKLLTILSVIAILPCLMIGIYILFHGSMGKIMRHQVSIVASIEKDLAPINKEIVEANKDSIKIMAQAIGEGFEEAKRTKFCTNCGTKNQENDKFCSGCGTKVN